MFAKRKRWHFHFPILSTLLVILLMCSERHKDFIYFLKTYISIFGILLMNIYYDYSRMRKVKKFNSPINILYTIFVCGVFEIFPVVFQLLTTYHNKSHYLFVGTMGNPSSVALLMSICVPIGLYLISKIRNKTRTLTFALVICMSLIVVFARSRTGILSIITSFIFYKYSYIRKLTAKFSRTSLIIFFAISLLLLIVALYFFKVDSANGRIFIWMTSINMILNNPLLGLGHNGFSAYYMDYQASYFRDNPNSPFALTADNIVYPFNEILYLGINFGLLGIVIFVILLISFIHIIIKRCYNVKILLISIVSTLMIWCFFYNPLHEPFTWIILFSLIIIVIHMNNNVNYYLNILILLLSFSLFCLFVSHLHNKLSWYMVQNSSSSISDDVMQKYEELFSNLSNDVDFLYNYGAELHYTNQYEKSIHVLERCETMLNDYNVQMLLADNYYKLGNLDTAYEKFKYANEMIPNRFLPLYYELIICKKKNDIYRGVIIANTIIHKTEKNNTSPKVKRIKDEAKAFILNSQ